MIKEGDIAPDFELEEPQGHRVKISDFRGKNVVLYFYPKDLSSGCTKEAQAFRDNYKTLKRLNSEVIGVSNDSKEMHKKFIAKEHLPFILLSDPDKEVSKMYEVYKEKSLYGRKFMGIERSTFLIDKNGVIRKIWRKVKVQGHIEDVIKAIKNL